MKDALESPVALPWIRVYIYGDPENIEEAIYRCRAFLRLPSINDFRRFIFTSALATLIEMRSGSFGVIEGPQEALSRNPGATCSIVLRPYCSSSSQIYHWQRLAGGWTQKRPKSTVAHERRERTVCV